MYMVKEGCPGCGACSGICPVDALQPQGLGMMVAETCVDCGICAPACPVGLIEKAAEESPAEESSSPKPDNKKKGGA